MPLRDHFRPPLSRRSTWEGFHGQWPGMIVMQLNRALPPRFSAEPRVHLGSLFEIDVSAYEVDGPNLPTVDTANGSAWEPAQPSVAVETELLDTNEYEVLIFDQHRERRLVAAVELVSPANKDRPEARQAFVAKCEAQLRKGVSVSIVDVVTSRHFNLYAELLALIGQRDQTLGPEPPPIYAAACRWIPHGVKHLLQTWSHTLRIGEPLPTLPLWLGEHLCIPLELEPPYEETCRVLRLIAPPPG